MITFEWAYRMHAYIYIHIYIVNLIQTCDLSFTHQNLGNSVLTNFIIYTYSCIERCLLLQVICTLCPPQPEHLAKVYKRLAAKADHRDLAEMPWTWLNSPVFGTMPTGAGYCPATVSWWYLKKVTTSLFDAKHNLRVGKRCSLTPRWMMLETLEYNNSTKQCVFSILPSKSSNTFEWPGGQVRRWHVCLVVIHSFFGVLKGLHRSFRCLLFSNADRRFPGLLDGFLMQEIRLKRNETKLPTGVLSHDLVEQVLEIFSKITVHVVCNAYIYIYIDTCHQIFWTIIHIPKSLLRQVI